MWSCWNHHLFLFFCNGHSVWNSQSQTWLNVTAYHNAPWHYKMLRFIFDSVSLVYMYMHILLYSRASSVRGGLNSTFHFRYCGTIKDLTLKRSLCSQNGRLSLVVRFIGLGVLFFCLSSLPAKDPDASHHCTCTKMLSWLFFLLLRCIFHFVKRTSAFYSWSSILFILPDLYPFRYLVITLPC